MKRFLSVLSGLLAWIFLCGWGPFPDNQTLTPPEAFPFVNPSPTPRDFLTINSRHRVLTAVIDSGVDYNHPLLQNNLHFKTDFNGVPTGIGYDFVGNDPWPFYALASTTLVDPTAPFSARLLCKSAQALAARIASQFPALSFINPLRSMDTEISALAYHGTHVAGLMTFDRSDFGLLAYRIGPDEISTPEQHYLALAQAIEQAIQDGARIINMSLGATIRARGAEGPQIPPFITPFIDTIRNHPEILFIAAAGNEGLRVTGARSFEIPCSYDLPNLLCAGATDNTGLPTQFSNLIQNGAKIIFALGQDVWSLLPTPFCLTREFKRLIISLPEITDPNVLQPLASAAASSCASARKGLAALSGTSMAAPLTTHLAAEVLVDHPTLTPSEVIDTLFAHAVPGQMDGHPILKLEIKKPSWYGGDPTPAWRAIIPGRPGDRF